MKIICTISLNESEKQEFNALSRDIVYIDRNNFKEQDVLDADVILGNLKTDVIARCTNLKWLQLDSAGANTYAALPGDFVLTNASGAYGTAISEYMLACTMASMKKLYAYDELQKTHDWLNLGSVPTISGMKVLCLGMGNIGQEYAKRMKTLGASVDGVRRSSKDKPVCFDHQYLTQDLDSILPEYDIVAMSLPETKETIRIMNADRLARTKEKSILINVGRGSAIDEISLLKLSRKEHFRDVFLDVFEHEPLPRNNPLWNAPHVHVTPHIAGRFNAAVTRDNVLAIVKDNLSRYLKNESLNHVVDKKLGY